MKNFLNKKYVGAYILVVLGSVFLIDNLFGFGSHLAFRFLFKFWPLALIIPGLMVIFGEEEQESKKEKADQEKTSD